MLDDVTIILRGRVDGYRATLKQSYETYGAEGYKRSEVQDILSEMQSTAREMNGVVDFDQAGLRDSFKKMGEDTSRMPVFMH